MSEKMAVSCSRCGAYMTLHFGGYDNHLNWWECDSCGYKPVNEYHIIATTTTLPSLPKKRKV